MFQITYPSIRTALTHNVTDLSSAMQSLLALKPLLFGKNRIKPK